MRHRHHLPGRPACPLLPAADEVLTADVTRCLGRTYDGAFYLAALRYAQSLWREGKAAQCLLQLNKAMMADLTGGEEVLVAWPLPYAAKRWVIENRAPDEFLGNPVRHYQHLATRMSGPRAELRTWRAWACLHLAEAVLSGAEFPRDENQIAKEGLMIPAWDEVLARLRVVGLPGEAECVRAVVEQAD